MEEPLGFANNSKENARNLPLRILLIGYMGAGKTTIGKALANRLGIPFYDLDWYIENRMHATVKQIFDEKGEEGFRKIERAMLHEVAEFEHIVISCGGGTPCFFDNMDYMNRQGETIYLKASAQVLHEHLSMGKTIRPLLLNKTADEVHVFIEEQLKQREPFYEKAKNVLDVNILRNFKETQNAVDQIIKIIHKP